MIRVGIIGAGPNGSGNAKSLARHSARCRIAAVADPVASAAGKLAGVYGARAVADPADFLDDVDAVVISSPNFLHAGQAVQMARAGKHLFLEKPMALTVADADRIVDAVAAARVASMVGFSVRFTGLAQTMKARYEAGDMGDLVSIWSRRLGSLGIAPDSWRSQYTRSGGVMAELISHEIDYLVAVAGLPSSISCRRLSCVHDDPRANDHVWLTLGFGDEATGTIEGSQISTVSLYDKGIMGTRGALHTRNWMGELYFGKNQQEAERVTLLPDFDKHAHFLDAIEGRCASVADVAWGRNIVRISELALESAVAGKVIPCTWEGCA